MGKLFGTDGIRGIANQYPINCEVALKTGRAVGKLCTQKGFGCILIGKDTRVSGDMLESAVAAGAASTGIDVKLAGVIPTPGAAFLCADDDTAGIAVVISASHNPYQDNGIKIFDHKGEKLSDSDEIWIEDYILNGDFTGSDQIGTISQYEKSVEKYAGFLLSVLNVSQKHQKLRLIVDCSNGAAFKTAPLVFNEQLFEAAFINHTPDGKNINDNCGSQHTEDLEKTVVTAAADMGLAFDGDADRLIAVDETGRKITGDQILAICASYHKERLKKKIIVSTIMSNIGLSMALKEMNIEHLKSDVGDKKVLEVMKSHGASIGGEDSGHMIFLDHHSTGDGMLTALKLIEAVLETGKTVSQLSRVMTVYPQILMNVDVDPSRPDFTKNSKIADAIEKVEKELEGRGRVLIRYSGTQPLLRVMVEGPDQALIENQCSCLCDTIRQNLI